MKIEVVQSQAVKRGNRQPQHPFNLRVQPWQIQPCFIAPVLPGETLKNLMVMSRVVSDPLKDKLMGWWCEYFFFYVKHRDLSIRDNLVSMHLDQAFDISAQFSASNVKHFHNATQLNYVSACLNTVRDWYFRDADEPEPTAIDGLPPSKINNDGWWQSLRKGAATGPGAGATDGRLPGDVSTAPTAGVPAGYATQFAQWEAMVAAGVTNATFEDYLRSFGVKVAEEVNEEIYRPELVRYVRDFTYPTNTINPTTGLASSAAVWSVSERADKDRFFSEPGFLFGVQVVRPKVLLAGITGTFTSYMTKAFDWVPKILQDVDYMSLKSFATATGPAPVAFADTYWADIRDLFIYGEQFFNHTDQRNTVALPTTAGNVKYPIETDAAALFADTTTPLKYIRSDGLISLQIASSVSNDKTR